MQSINDDDFEIVAKFDTELSKKIQMMGILVQQDDNWGWQARIGQFIVGVEGYQPRDTAHDDPDILTGTALGPP